MGVSPAVRQHIGKRAGKWILRLATYILLIDLSFVFIYPFFVHAFHFAEKL